MSDNYEDFETCALCNGRLDDDTEALCRSCQDELLMSQIKRVSKGEGTNDIERFVGRRESKFSS
jgi:hypothetical protein